MSNNTNEIQVVTPDKDQQTAIYLLTKAEVDVQISTAKAFPRSIAEFRKDVLSMATVTEDVAESCIYALPRKKKNDATGAWETVYIEGKSVRLAEIVVSCYGNIRAGKRVVDNDGKKITAQGICHDLQKNTCITLEVSTRITDKHGKTYNDDMQIVTGNAAASKAMRNAVFGVVPSALIEDIFEDIKKVAKGTAATLKIRRDRAIEHFIGLGVTVKQICAALDVKGVEDIDLDKLLMLSGFKTAIKDGDSTVKDIFEKPDPMDASALLEILQANEPLFDPTEYKAMKAILTNGKAQEFDKVKKALEGKGVTL